MRTKLEHDRDLAGMFSGKEATLSVVSSISIECGDCGRHRWRRPQELYRGKVGPSTPLTQLGMKLVCSACVDEGMPGKNVTIQAAFMTTIERDRAEAYRLNSQAIRAAG